MWTTLMWFHWSWTVSRHRQPYLTDGLCIRPVLVCILLLLHWVTGLSCWCSAAGYKVSAESGHLWPVHARVTTETCSRTWQVQGRRRQACRSCPGGKVWYLDLSDNYTRRHLERLPAPVTETTCFTLHISVSDNHTRCYLERLPAPVTETTCFTLHISVSAVLASTALETNFA